MESKMHIGIDELAKLISAAHKLEPGEAKIVYVSVDSETTPLYTEAFDETECRIVQKPKKRNKLVKALFSRVCDFMNSLADPTLDDGYVEYENFLEDEKGRKYLLDEDRSRKYYDERGFIYRISWAEDGREIMWTMFDNGKIGVFLDEDRRKVVIDGVLCFMDDDLVVDYNDSIPYIGPRFF